MLDSNSKIVREKFYSLEQYILAYPQKGNKPPLPITPVDDAFNKIFEDCIRRGMPDYPVGRATVGEVMTWLAWPDIGLVSKIALGVYLNANGWTRKVSIRRGKKGTYWRKNYPSIEYLI